MRLPQIMVLLLTLASMGLMACAPAPSRGGSKVVPAAGPKRITAGIRGDPKTLSDSINFAAGGSSVAGVREIENLLNAGLTVSRPDGTQGPQLAEVAPTLENGLWKLLPDGHMELTWKLRRNVVWHDGALVIADDFVFTSHVAQDKSLPMSQDPAFKFIESVEAPDPQTLLVRWNQPFVDADKLFSQTRNNRNLPMPEHLLETTYLEDKVSFTQSPVFGQNYTGTGPYKLQAWELGSFLNLTANDQYVLGRPKIDEIQVRFILDTNTIMAYILSGAVDITLGRGLDPEQAILVRQQWSDGSVDAGLQNTTQLRPQFLNAQPTQLTDARFRRALMHAMDRQQIVDTFLAGFVPVADSNYSPEEPEYKDIQSQSVRYEFDPRKSIQILEGMGLSRGADGLFRDASGALVAPIEIRTRTHPLREKVQQVIAEEWHDVGLVGEPLVVPEQRINDREYQATYPGFYFRFGGPDVNEFDSCCIPGPENNFSGNDGTRYESAELNGLLQRFRTTIPRAERMEVLGQIMHHITDQLVILPMYHEPEPVLISNHLVGATGRRADDVQTWNVQDWDLR